MKMTNKTYDRLKTIALIIAPILTFASAVCVIWSVPYSEQITATLAALATLFGAFLKDSSEKYHEEKEQIMATNDTDENQMLLIENMLEEDEQEMIKGE